MKQYLDAILDLVFPPKCETCGNSSKIALCQDCFSSVRFMKPQLGIHSMAVYDNVIKQALHQLKFNKRKNLIDPLSRLLVQYLSQTPYLELKEIDMVVPVPLHRNRLKERGFNQSVLLAQSIQQYYSVQIVEALVRTRDTKAQFGLKREERFINVNAAFKLAANSRVAGKNILLFDDIYTTGATIMECTKVLKSAGANKLEVLTLSRAIEH